MLTTSTCDIQKLFSVACLPGEAHSSIKTLLLTPQTSLCWKIILFSLNLLLEFKQFHTLMMRREESKDALMFFFIMKYSLSLFKMYLGYLNRTYHL